MAHGAVLAVVKSETRLDATHATAFVKQAELVCNLLDFYATLVP
jgi:hypothetical protein